MISLGSTVVLIASDEELRSNGCSEELVEGGVGYVVTEIDEDDEQYELDGLGSGWVPWDWVALDTSGATGLDDDTIYE